MLGGRNNNTVRIAYLCCQILDYLAVRLIIGLIEHGYLRNIKDINISHVPEPVRHEHQQFCIIRAFIYRSADCRKFHITPLYIQISRDTCCPYFSLISKLITPGTRHFAHGPYAASSAEDPRAERHSS